MSVWLIGAIGAATAALLLLVVFFFGGGGALAAPEKGDGTTAAKQSGSVVQVGEQPSEKVLDAERKASAAFTELEARLALLPDDAARRRVLCQEFLRKHGTTIVASRVRVLMDGK